MVETNRITGALGLENLKNLGETVKQVAELQKSLNESKEGLTKLLEANNPISKSIAQSLDAQTLKSLKEGDMTALEELKTKLGEENQRLLTLTSCVLLLCRFFRAAQHG